MPDLYESDLCEHAIEREGCVQCGPLDGRVFDARCSTCAANTWHAEHDRRCLRCGHRAPPGDTSIFARARAAVPLLEALARDLAEHPERYVLHAAIGETTICGLPFLHVPEGPDKPNASWVLCHPDARERKIEETVRGGFWDDVTCDACRSRLGLWVDLPNLVSSRFSDLDCLEADVVERVLRAEPARARAIYEEHCASTARLLRFVEASDFIEASDATIVSILRNRILSASFPEVSRAYHRLAVEVIPRLIAGITGGPR